MAAQEQSSTFAPAAQIRLSTIEGHALLECIGLAEHCFDLKYNPQELNKFFASILTIKVICCKLLAEQQRPFGECFDAFNSLNYTALIEKGLLQLHEAGYPRETVDFLRAIENIINISGSAASRSFHNNPVDHEYFSSRHCRLIGLSTEITAYLSRFN